MVVRERWSVGARRLGIVSAMGLLVIGILYVLVIALWLILQRTPGEPIPDPYLALMEVLTMAAAPALVGLTTAVWHFAVAERRLHALGALITGSLAACVTMAVHFVQLTAIRQMWRAGHVADYRLVWPSPLFAIEYFSWDLLVGLAMVFAGCALAGNSVARHARGALLLGGALCLAGLAGPLSGRIVFQNLAVLGYAVVLPTAGALTARAFRAAPPHRDTVA